MINNKADRRKKMNLSNFFISDVALLFISLLREIMTFLFFDLLQPSPSQQDS